MKNKILYLLVLMIFLTGCSVTADITINDNMTITENVSIAFDNSLADNYHSPGQYASDYLDYYNSAISLKNYKYKIEESSVKSYVNFNKTSKNICDNINYSLFSQYLYKKINCISEDGYFIVKSEGEQLVSTPSSKKKFNVETVKLTMNLPVAALDNNADEVNGNSYIWYFNENSISDKSLYLKISKNALEENKSIKKQKEQRLDIIKKSIIILITLVGIASVLVISYKKYKENQIEY